MSNIILLNGCGSAGKTSVAKAIQHIDKHPWMRFSIDMFIDMMSDKHMAFGERAEDGYFSFVPGENERGPSCEVKVGPLGELIFHNLPKIAKLLADSGNNLIIEEVFFGEDELLVEYKKQLAGHKLCFVGVHCDLKVMQERELLRGDRAIGLSNWQIDLVHSGIRGYDIEVDTTNRSVFDVAKEIIGYF